MDIERLKAVAKKAREDEAVMRRNCSVRAFDGAATADALAATNKLIADLADLLLQAKQ